MAPGMMRLKSGMVVSTTTHEDDAEVDNDLLTGFCTINMMLSCGTMIGSAYVGIVTVSVQYSHDKSAPLNGHYNSLSDVHLIPVAICSSVVISIAPLCTCDSPTTIPCRSNTHAPSLLYYYYYYYYYY